MKKYANIKMLKLQNKSFIKGLLSLFSCLHFCSFLLFACTLENTLNNFIKVYCEISIVLIFTASFLKGKFVKPIVSVIAEFKKGGSLYFYLFSFWNIDFFFCIS